MADDPSPDTFSSPDAVEPDEPDAVEPAPDKNAPSPEVFSKLLNGGYSSDEISAWAKGKGMSDEDIASGLSVATPATRIHATQAQTAAGPELYTPEAEANSLRIADQIRDPEERLQTQRLLKQEYANIRIMDGISANARTETINKAEAEYINATHEIYQGKNMTWAQQLKAAELVQQKLWSDTRLDYGEHKLRILRTIEGMVATNQAKPAVSHGNTAHFLARMRLPDGDPNKLTDENAMDELNNLLADQKINREDYKFIRDDFLLDNKTPEGRALKQERDSFFHKFSASIDPSRAIGGPATALGEQNIYKAEFAARMLEKEMRKKGHNPHDLYNPNSKDYFGSEANLQKYQASMADAMEYGSRMGMSAEERAAADAAAATVKAAGTKPPPKPTGPTLGQRLGTWFGWGSDENVPPELRPAKPAPTPTLFDASKMTPEQLGKLALDPAMSGRRIILPSGRIGTVPSAVPQSK